jgi:hypothetical protein
MQQIEKNGNVIGYNGYIYEYISYDKIDDMCVHISMKPLWHDTSGFEIISLLGNDTKVNGVFKNTAQEIIDSL